MHLPARRKGRGRNWNESTKRDESILWKTQTKSSRPRLADLAGPAHAVVLRTSETKRPVRGDNRTGQAIWALGVDGRSRRIQPLGRDDRSPQILVATRLWDVQRPL